MPAMTFGGIVRRPDQQTELVGPPAWRGNFGARARHVSPMQHSSTTQQLLAHPRARRRAACSHVPPAASRDMRAAISASRPWATCWYRRLAPAEL